MDTKSINHFNYLTVNDKDREWGLFLTTCGYQSIPPSKVNPFLSIHPSVYSFNTKRGRVLDEFQLLFIVKGSGSFESTHCAKTQISAGNIILLFPGEWHNYSYDAHTGWDEYWVGFDGINARSMMPSSFFSESDPVFKVGIDDEFISYYKSIIEYAEQEAKGYQQVASSIVRHMLGLLYFKTQNSLFSDKEVVDKINQARIIIRNNINNKISPAEVAEQLGLGYSWFRKAFKKYAGISPAQFQLQIRLQRAKDLLLNTNLSVSEIAYELTFDTPGQFSTFFRQKAGLTPKEFRNTGRLKMDSNNPALEQTATESDDTDKPV
ncbi:MAG: AraC family transcriptional regulator [Bacteroidota bacterium]|nr:AraC family transcriptional regulator [Bacteroidota bacterium]